MTSLDTASTMLISQEPPARSFDEEQMTVATIDCRLSTVCGFYRFAHIDGIITSNPAQYVRRPQSPSGRGERSGSQRVRCVLVHRRTLRPRPRRARRTARAQRTARNRGMRDQRRRSGLRARAPNPQDPREGNKPATIPLVPRTARTVDLAVGERCEGPILRRHDGHRLDRRTAHRWVKAIGGRVGLGHVYPHMLRSAFIMAALDAGVPYVPCRSRPATPTLAPPRSTTDVARTSIVTPPTSSSHLSPAAEPSHRSDRIDSGRC